MTIKQNKPFVCDRDREVEAMIFPFRKSTNKHPGMQGFSQKPDYDGKLQLVRYLFTGLKWF